VIADASQRHYRVLAQDRSTASPADESKAGTPAALAGRMPANALRHLVEEHYDFIWRLLARLGVASPEVDDAAQQVFMVLVSREQLSIKPGSERAFLYGVALRVAKEFRRHARSSGQALSEAEEVVDRESDVEVIAERSRARQKLDRILDQMPDKLRVAFILFELEDMSVPEIAVLLEIPAGTAASRLRRARALFQAAVVELRARGQGVGS
jgi:RNA polymerase sigma-70 factor (ECF subfamily)